MKMNTCAICNNDFIKELVLHERDNVLSLCCARQ